MPLFTRRNDLGVQSLVLKMVNNNCAELRAAMEGPRNDSRVNLLLVVMVIPMEKKRPATHKMFMAVSKEFSNTGVALVVDTPQAFSQAILGFRFEGEMHYLLSELKHVNPIGGGFYQLGFQMLKVVTPHDYPSLETMTF